ncbi:MAG: hypothetical protein F4W68_04800 [Cenarchaeum sp. SB0661_bin_35]|nr:hypothetical protein [Cenarchaeum sp. SB0667_bin_13]MXZ94220.1 hypothetical protein [Cenarchaeum sp. SB0666_bin_15]MYC79797.1 hypothetical protein [Cenarchaeum sp. SB0661_bin_35]MYI52357.1 hypothetical protein [Cenarchaeum sp. SB0673_bin_9]
MSKHKRREVYYEAARETEVPHIQKTLIYENPAPHSVSKTRSINSIHSKKKLTSGCWPTTRHTTKLNLM